MGVMMVTQGRTEVMNHLKVYLSTPRMEMESLMGDLFESEDMLQYKPLFMRGVQELRILQTSTTQTMSQPIPFLGLI